MGFWLLVPGVGMGGGGTVTPTFIADATDADVKASPLVAAWKVGWQ
jgi:hypothetical protein